MTDTLDFHVDRLEDRQMLAGNVTVEVTNAGDLKITGDDSFNDIVVEEVGNQLQISSKFYPRTTFNFGSFLNINRTSFRNLKVDLGDGGGNVDWKGGGNFKNGVVKLGSKNPDQNAHTGFFTRLEMSNVDFSGNLRINMGVTTDMYNPGGLGTNIVYIGGGSTVEGRLAIKGTSKTEDRVVFGDGDFGKTTVRLSGGDDIVELNGGHFHQLLTDGGRDNDTLGGSGITWDKIPTHKNFEIFD
jgi:hypothetical protein